MSLEKLPHNDGVPYDTKYTILCTSNKLNDKRWIPWKWLKFESGRFKMVKLFTKLQIEALITKLIICGYWQDTWRSPNPFTLTSHMATPSLVSALVFTYIGFSLGCGSKKHGVQTHSYEIIKIGSKLEDYIKCVT
jgi:hypothetical protein